MKGIPQQGKEIQWGPTPQHEFRDPWPSQVIVYSKIIPQEAKLVGVLVCELVCCFLTWTAYVKTPETQKDKGDKKDINGCVKTQLQSRGWESGWTAG